MHIEYQQKGAMIRSVFIISGSWALEQNFYNETALAATCHRSVQAPRSPTPYVKLWEGPMIHAPSGCARPTVQCGPDLNIATHQPPKPVNHVMTSGRGKWYWVGNDCKQHSPPPVISRTYVGHTFHLVDEGVVIAEHTVQDGDTFMQGLPCHKRTIDINCAKEFVGKVPTLGMHVLCFTKGRVCAYRDGSGSCELLEGENLTTVEQIAYAMDLPPRLEGQNRMRFYTTGGKWAESVNGHDTVLLFEDGVWFWPVMELDYARIVSTTDRDVHMITRSVTPPIFEIHEPMVDQSEIDKILNTTQAMLAQSTVGMHDSRRTENIARTSSGAFLQPHMVDDELFKFYERVQSLIRLPLVRSELLQVLKYEPGQFYVPHPDSLHGVYPNIHQDRIATFITNFADVAKGGATGFTQARTQPNMVEKECAAFEMPALKGKTMFFYSSHANGMVNDASEHTGCEVKEGVKLASNFWFWNGFEKNIVESKNYIWHRDQRSIEKSRPYLIDADIAHFASRGTELK